MEKFNIQKFVLLLTWISIFAMLWLMILGFIPAKMLWSWGFLGIFLFIGLGASSSESSKPKFH